MSELNFYSTEKTGLLANLATTEKGTLVGAINENTNEISDVKADLTDLATFPVSIDLTEVEYEQGYLASGGVFTATSGANSQKTTVAISLDEGTYKVTVSGVDSSTTVSYVRAIAIYNSDDVCTKYMQDTNMTTFTVGEGDAYVRINTKYTSVTTYMLEEQNASVTLNDDVDIPASTINKVVNPTPTILDVSSVSYEQGYLASNGVFTATSGSNQQKTTVAISLDAGDYVVSFDGTMTSGDVSSGVYKPRAVAVYDSSDVCTYYYLTETANTDIYFTVKETDSYVRINTQYATENVYALKSIIPNKPNYLPYRRPIIAFIFDGEYNYNDEFKVLFDEFGKKCGFALQYDTTFANTSLETYQSWEQNGFEILAHSSEAVGTQSSATDDDIAQIVRKSYFKMVENGFNVHGFVAYQGNAKDIAIQTAQKWFDYGATQANHSGSYTETYPDLVEPVLYFGTDSPYHLWRYSMQTSTLAQMKSAVDSCYSNNGLVLFYGHANSSALNNMTVDNIRELLTYIMGYGIPIMTPYDAIRDYYSVRYQDVVSE